MENKRYWHDRAIEREQHWYDLTTQALNEEVKLYYKKSLEKIQRDIAALYARFGIENKLTPAEARRLIRGEEFKVWRMTLQEYIQAAKNDSAILKELNTLAMRSRISRFEALHARTLMEIADLCEKLNQFEDSFQYRAYLANLYGNLYDIHRTVGLTTPPVAVDKNQAEKVIRTAWSGANYSSRIWKNGEKLGREIKQVMLTAVHRGTSIQKLSKNLSRRMEVGYNNAERLVRTELNYVQNRAALDSIASSGLEYYQFNAALDHRTCPRCGSLDGQIFSLEEAMQGENYPPLHPRCRCTVTAALGEDLPIKRKSRIAERREKVPAEMTYADWKSVYVDKTQTLEDVVAKGIPAGGKLPFKQQAHFLTSDENILATNPNYHLGLEYQQNCQRCVPAYEMRMRGFDVIAKPVYDLATDDFANNHWTEAFDNAIIEENLAGTGKEHIIKRMIEWGDGARAEIYVAWETDDLFHVFVAENRNGYIHFLDPQNGELDAGYYFENVKYGATKFFRINNLEINKTYIMECCEAISL